MTILMNTKISFAKVMDAMRTTRHHFQIFNSIVEFIAIPMMHDLRGLQTSAQRPFHYYTMFKTLLPSVAEIPVACCPMNETAPRTKPQSTDVLCAALFRARRAMSPFLLAAIDFLKIGRTANRTPLTQAHIGALYTALT